MDKTYIEMCRKADEIQGLTPKVGDRVVFLDDHNNVIDESIVHINNEGTLTADCHGHPVKNCLNLYFVPQQEDLQKIIEDNYKLGLRGPWLLSSSFLRFVENIIPEILIRIDLTTAWLMFVMEKCFNKEWNPISEKWVVING